MNHFAQRIAVCAGCYIRCYGEIDVKLRAMLCMLACYVDSCVKSIKNAIPLNVVYPLKIELGAVLVK